MTQFKLLLLLLIVVPLLIIYAPLLWLTNMVSRLIDFAIKKAGGREP